MVDRYALLSPYSSVVLVAGTQIYFAYLSYMRAMFCQHCPFCLKPQQCHILFPCHSDILQARGASSD